MRRKLLIEEAEHHLRVLCENLQSRRVGSEGNRQATSYFAQKVASFGFHTESAEFVCMDWLGGAAQLSVGGRAFEAQVSPYSLAVQCTAPLGAASTIDHLEGLDASGEILLVHGDLAAEQLMPKNFTFYNPEHHQRIVHLLQQANPLAIVAATSRDPALAGGVYPFPLIEDGDFDIPSVYMTDEEGARLAAHQGQQVCLEAHAQRIPSTGCNVMARKGARSDSRLVICAHIDAKIGTPGALDNATGIVVLLLLARLLEAYAGELGLEIIALNGEDYYAASGEVQFVEMNAGRFDQIVLGINMDLAGYHEGDTAYSLYGCPEPVAAPIHRAFSATGFVEGEQWYQSDHSLFVQNGRPALAVTSDCFATLSAEVTHTPRDRPELVDCAKLADITLALSDLILDLARRKAT